MKKTLVALAIAATAATSANAVTVYEADGTKVEVGGSVRLYLGRIGDEQRGDLVNDGSRINIKVNQELGNGLSAFGAYQLRFAQGVNSTNRTTNTFGNPSTKRLYAGFAHKDVGSLSFGRQATNADDVLQDSAYFNSGWLNPLTFEGNKVVKFRSAEVNGLSFGLDYLFGDADKTSQDTEYKQGYAASVFYDYALGDHNFNFAAVYAQDKYDSGLLNAESATGRKYTSWATHLGYNFAGFDLGLNYGQYRNKFENGTTIGAFDSSELTETSRKGNYFLVDAGYRVIEPSRVYVQWERLDGKSDVTVANGVEKAAIVNRYVAGVDYRLHKNVLTYVEYAQQREKISVQGEAHQTNVDNVFGVGLRVYF
ncbi:putative porin [Volucribacter psittacicida]|uniref:Putative porin n=1 Tax=Volucribacter psittacicida TaxID=203482 RepID=A0A4R1G1D0_9PAST|nr:porin [Volucribacter psittacicida]TCK01897.1 putative porin [Volucribacter psittacicida]